MYWADPNNPQAYEVPDEFRFGTELLVAPIVSDNDDSAQLGSTEAWLPQGEWYDFFDGRRYVSAGESGRRLEVWRAIDRMPVFAKAGGIVPLQQLGEGNKVNDLGNPESCRCWCSPVRTVRSHSRKTMVLWPLLLPVLHLPSLAMAKLMLPIRA